jgi:hypothetical protein
LIASITIENYPLAWPVSNRDFVLSNTVFKSTEGPTTYYIVRKSVEYDKAPIRKGTVRATLFAAWILQRSPSSNTTKYTKIYYRNMLERDTTNNKLLTFWNHLNKKIANNLHGGITQAMKQFIKDGAKRPKYSNGLLNTLEDFEHLLANRPVLLRTTSDGRPEVDKEQLEILKAFWQDNSDHKGDTGGELKRITYISKFAQPFTNDELRTVGEISVSNNRFKNITGILLCAEQTFYQIIEGLPDDIDKLYAKICRDARHTHIKTLNEEFGIRESERQFPIWSMRTVNLDEQTDHFFAQQLKEMIQMVSDRQFGTEPDECSTIISLGQFSKDRKEDDNSDSWSEWDAEASFMAVGSPRF